MRLFCDVDDTLIDRYDNPNEHVIRFVKKWEGEVIVWSGGGQKYAETWANRLLDGYYDSAIAKDMTIPTEYDLLIDDQELRYRGKLIGKEQIRPWHINEPA